MNGFQCRKSVIRITAVGDGWAGTVAAAKEKDKVERFCGWVLAFGYVQAYEHTYNGAARDHFFTSAAAIATNKIQNRSLRPNRK